MSHSDPEHPKKNPHPVQRYEVIATTDAPGPWDKVSGTVFFGVTNLACTPKDEFVGVHAKPRDVPIDFEMTQTGKNTWVGHFYRDAMLDANYYGLGICHWDAAVVTPVFVVHGRSFGAPTGLKEDLKQPQLLYFKKRDYANHSLNQVYGTSPEDPEVANHPDAFFSINVAIKEKP
jgi:hypothetical protein